jgi:hypothetical protein
MIDELLCGPSQAFGLIHGVQGQLPKITIAARLLWLPMCNLQYRRGELLDIAFASRFLLHSFNAITRPIRLRRQIAGPNQALCHSHYFATTPMHVFLRFVAQQGKEKVFGTVSVIVSHFLHMTQLHIRAFGFNVAMYKKSQGFS